MDMESGSIRHIVNSTFDAALMQRLSMHRQNISGSRNAREKEFTGGNKKKNSNNFSFGADNYVDAIPFQNNFYPGLNGIYGNYNSPSSSLSLLKCAECDITKEGWNELEVHIKTEHLQWLPFQCPLCDAERATDSQMREHLHSTHRSSTNQFRYLDNITSKRNFQNIMERSLYKLALIHVSQNFNSQNFIQHSIVHPAEVTNLVDKTSNQRGNSKEHNKTRDPIAPTSNISPPAEPCESVEDNPLRNLVSMTTERANFLPARQQSPTSITSTSRTRPSADMTYSGNSHTQALLSAINAFANADAARQMNSGENITVDNGDNDLSVNEVFSKKDNKSQSERDEAAINVDEENNERKTASILSNLAALFKDETSVRPIRRSDTKNRIESSSTSKRRVLGMCNKCKKPITAGARQMHMFYHLAKDHQTYRFKCLHSSCTVQHYRKDQMENHQLKAHQTVDPNSIQDRTSELFDVCQDLSMKLLGTTGNVPGPTAAKAQIVYDQCVAACTSKQSRRKRRRLSISHASNSKIQSEEIFNVPNSTRSIQNDMNNQSSTHAERDADSVIVKAPSITIVNKTSVAPADTNDETHQTPTQDIQSKSVPECILNAASRCRICEKLLKNRFRGLHVLSHLAKDEGISRYACKVCEYGRDRSQLVRLHGEKEHGIKDCVDDRISLYAKEVKDMCQRCFGFQALYSQVFSKKAEATGVEQMTNVEPKLKQKKVCWRSDANHKEEAIKGSDLFSSSFVASSSDDNQQLKKNSRRSLSSNSSSSPFSQRFRRTTRQFGTRNISKSKRMEIAILQKKSRKFGGAQYIKKRLNQIVHCEKCGVEVVTQLVHHAYTHSNLKLFLCPHCHIGSSSRMSIARHIRDTHHSIIPPIDERIKYTAEIKELMRSCFFKVFVDAPLPADDDRTELLNMNTLVSATFDNNQEQVEIRMDDSVQNSGLSVSSNLSDRNMPISEECDILRLSSTRKNPVTMKDSSIASASNFHDGVDRPACKKIKTEECIRVQHKESLDIEQNCRSNTSVDARLENDFSVEQLRKSNLELTSDEDELDKIHTSISIEHDKRTKCRSVDDILLMKSVRECDEVYERKVFDEEQEEEV